MFDLFGLCDLDLDSMTFIHELDPKTVEMHRMCKYELPTSRLFGSYRLTDIHTYRQTDSDRQTDRHTHTYR